MASAVVNREHDESIEVEVNTTTNTVCASYPSFTFNGSSSFSTAPYTETIGVTKSYDSGERAIDDIFSELEESGKKSSALKGEEFIIERTQTKDTSIDSWLSSPSSEVNEYGGNLESVSFTFFEPGTVVNREFDESIEVEVNTITKTVYASFFLFTSHSNNSFLRRSNIETIGIVKKSYDKSDRAIDGLSLELEVSSETKSLAESYINVERMLTAETSNLAPSSDCQQDGVIISLTDDADETDANGRTEDGHGSVLTKCIVGEIVKAIEDGTEVEGIKNEYAKSYSFLTVSCNETSGSMTEYYDSDDRATDNKLTELDVSGKKSSAFEGKEFNLLCPPTEETTMDSWTSASSAEYQDDGEAENPSYDVDELDASGRSKDEIGSVVTNYLEGEIVNATEDEGPDFEGIKNEYVVEADASSEAQEDEFTSYATDRGPKIKGIADERVAVANVDGESSSNLILQHSTDTDAVFAKLSNEAKILHLVVARTMQGNKELIKSTKYLKTKNGDYAKQANPLLTTVDELVVSNSENIQRMSSLEDDVVAKKIMIDKVTEDIHNKIISSEEVTTEYVHLSKGIKNECVVEGDADIKAQDEISIPVTTEECPKVVFVVDTNEVSKDEIEHVCACRPVASSDKLAAMVHHRTQAINGVRGLLEREREKGKSSRHADQSNLLLAYYWLTCNCNNSAETDVFIKLRNYVMSKRQEKKELIKSVKHLTTKNGDYAEQVSQLSSTVDKLVISNSENTRVSSVAAKMISTDEITRNIRKKNISLEEETYLLEQLQHSQAESDGLKADVQALVVANKENIHQMTVLEDNVAAKKMKMNIQTWCTTCKEMAAKNAALNAQLDFSKAESDGFKAAIKDVESKYTNIFSELKNVVSNLREMIELNDALQAENDALNEQLISKFESDGREEAVQVLKSKNTSYDSELKKLVSSLQDMAKLNGKLQAQVEQVSAANEELGKLKNDSEKKNAELSDVIECLAKSLNDERSMFEEEKEEMQKMMEMVATLSDQFVQLVCWGMKPNRPRHVQQQWRKGTSVAPILPCFFA